MIPKSLIGAGIGYVLALVSSSFMPQFASLLLPVLGAAIGALGMEKNRPAGGSTQERPHAGGTNAQTSHTPSPEPQRLPWPQPAQGQAPQSVPNQSVPVQASAGNGVRTSRDAENVNPIFEPVLQYLDVLEDMVISEGQQNNLDNEIVDKSCSLFLRLQRVIPLISELHNDEVNHTIKRLVLKDLNSVINPFLRLSGEAKSKNRRILLNGLKDVDSKITQIVRTIEHKDLLELQSRAEIIHQRYANS